MARKMRDSGVAAGKVFHAEAQRGRGAEKMKPSGIPWIGDIPEGWVVRRLRYIATSFRKGAGITKADVIADGDIACIRYGDIYSKYKNDVAVVKCLSRTDKNLVVSPQQIFKGEILFSCTGELIEEIGKNIAYMGDEECLAGGDIIIVGHNQNPVFLSYALNSYAQTQKSHDKAKLKVVHISTEGIKDLLICLPSLPEQRRIADYLDEKCAAIDGAVCELKRGIEDCKAWKKAIIFEAVTGKANVLAAKNAKVAKRQMRDSGIPWIGEIPEGWEICKALYALSMPITDGPHTTPELFDHGVPFVSAEAVSCGNGSIDFAHIRGYISEVFYQECCQKYIPHRDDIFMIKSGATTGRVAIVDTDERFTIWSPLAVFRVKPEKALPKYFFYMLQSPVYQKQVELGWSYGTQQNIGMRALEQLKILMPPLPEQQAIADYLDEKCAAIDALAAEKEKLIANLEAYKKSLIFELVTGKREVA